GVQQIDRLRRDFGEYAAARRRNYLSFRTEVARRGDGYCRWWRTFAHDLVPFGWQKAAAAGAALKFYASILSCAGCGFHQSYGYHGELNYRSPSINNGKIAVGLESKQGHTDES